MSQSQAAHKATIIPEQPSTLDSAGMLLINKEPIDFVPAPRATFGFVCLPTDIMSEREIPAVLSQVPGVQWRFQKLRMDGDDITVESYESAREHIGEAAATLRPKNSMDILAVACTSLSFTLGTDVINESIRTAHPQSKVTNTASSVVDALHFVGAKRVAVLSPYALDLSQRHSAFLDEAGFEIVNSINLGLATDEEISRVSQDYIRKQALKLVEPGSHGETADTVLIACSAFHTLGKHFIDQLERELGRVVITSQQAQIWNMLRIAGFSETIYEHGRLLRMDRLNQTPSIVPATPKKSANDDFSDVYPSRQPGVRAELLPRLDPIIDYAQLNNGPLTPQQMLNFERDGAMVMRNVFTAAEIAVLRQQVVGLREEYETLPHDEIDNTDSLKLITEKAVGGASGSKATLKSIWEVHKKPEDSPHLRRAGSILYGLVNNERLVNVARQILGDEVYVHQSRINFQQGFSESNPLGGTGFLWHQDFEQWHADDGMPRMRAVSMAVLLDRNTEVNASLMVLPGSQRYFIQADAYDASKLTPDQAALRLRTGPMLNDEIVGQLANECSIQYCRGEPGDVVVFDCATLHGSHSNISPWPRQNVFFVYNAVSNILRPEGGYDPQSPKRPEHIACRSKDYMGVAIKPLKQSLTEI